MSWEMKRIGEVCDVIPGFAFKSKDLGETGIPVVKIGNITDDYRVDIDSIQYLPESLIKEMHEKFMLANDDIVIAMTGATAGKVGRIRCPKEQVLLLNQRVAKFKPRNINPDFFWSAISTPRYRTIFYGLGGGAAQPNMSGEQIEDVKIPYPPPTVQDRIASILSAYDDLIENNRRRIQLLEQAARLRYKEWFVHLRFPSHERIKIKDGVPEGWRKKTFGEVAENFDRFRVPLSVLERENRVGPYPCHGAAGILGYIDDFLFDGRFLLIGEDGTVFTRSGSAMLQFVEGKFWVSNHAHVVRGNSVSTEFLYCFMSHYSIQPHVTGVAQPKLSQKNLNRIEMLVPSTELNTLFSDVMEPLFQQAFKLKSQIDTIAKARDLLLPRLMNGQVAA